MMMMVDIQILCPRSDHHDYHLSGARAREGSDPLVLVLLGLGAFGAVRGVRKSKSKKDK